MEQPNIVEQSVIGSILQEPTRVMAVCRDEGLSPEAFTDPACNLVYRACYWLDENKKPIDITSVQNVLTQYGKLDVVGGSMGLDKLIDATPTASHAEYYVEQVSEAWTLRTIEADGKTMVEAVKNPDAKSSDIIAEYMQKLVNLSDNKRDRSLDKNQLWQKVRAMAHASKEGVPIGLPSPWPEFTKRTGGARFGLVTAIAGRKGTRKSYISHQWGLYASVQAENKIPGAYYPLEDGQEIGFIRAACCLAKVNCWHYEHGRFTPEQSELVDKAAAQLIKSEYHIRAGRGLSLPQFRLEIARGVAKYGWKFVIIDAFKDLDDSGGDYRSEGKISKWTQDVADEFDLAFLLVHHVKKNRDDDRTEQDKEQQKLKIEDIRGHSRLVDDAKQINILQCKRIVDERGAIIYDDYVLDCAANNFGPTSAMCLDLDSGTGIFTENTIRQPWSQFNAKQVTPKKDWWNK